MKTEHEQAGADEEAERERDLGDDEEVAEGFGGGAAAGAAGAVFQDGADVSAGGLQSGVEADEEAGDEGDDEGEGEDGVPVPRVHLQGELGGDGEEEVARGEAREDGPDRGGVPRPVEAAADEERRRAKGLGEPKKGGVLHVGR